MSIDPVVREDAAERTVVSLEDARHRRRVHDLIAQHGEYVRGLARKLCRVHVDPDDLLQDVFEKLMRSQPLPDLASERSWLARVVHNQFIDKLRRHAARREEPIEHAGEPTPPADDQVWWEALSEDAVRDAVAQLPADQRATFELFAFAGRSYDEIAAELGIAKATVGTRILRARSKIRERLIAARWPDGSHDG